VLHYQSHRPGLGALTIGIIKGVATTLYGIEVWRRRCHHHRR
jgi:hypothetical protein